jgi:hydroxymethylglutaryl-CoA lyase
VRIVPVGPTIATQFRGKAMSARWPKVNWKEESMRDGMQIEDAAIPVEDKVRLLDALSETGLKNIVVGSFVSPGWTPQMARIDEIVQQFHPRPGVTYTALALNPRGVERARQYCPPLTIEEDPYPRLTCHMCDVFVRRNANRSQMQEMERWPEIVARAKDCGAEKVGLEVLACWGSNFLGPFPVDALMAMLEAQHRIWDDAGKQVVSVALFDPMSFCMPHKVEETLYRIKDRWPEITHFQLHLHNARNMVLPSIYAALRALGPEDTLYLDGAIGGIGGCPYCGNGRATGMAPTEDVMHMLEDMGIETGVDMDKLIECACLCEEIVGHSLYGHVSKAGPIPHRVEEFYDGTIPFVETLEQARHFKLGPKAYQGGLSPWKTPIESPYRERIENGLPAYDPPDGQFPWTESWFGGAQPKLLP